MENMVINLEKIEGIYDIQPLIEPALSPLEITLLLMLLLSFIGIITYRLWIKLYSKRSIAQRKIKQLYTLYSQNKINSRNAVYQLCQAFTEGLKLKDLSEKTTLPDKLLSKRKRWAAFVNEISILRYTNNEKTSSKINKAFTESLYWLTNWS